MLYYNDLRQHDQSLHAGSRHGQHHLVAHPVDLSPARETTLSSPGCKPSMAGEKTKPGTALGMHSTIHPACGEMTKPVATVAGWVIDPSPHTGRR